MERKARVPRRFCELERATVLLYDRSRKAQSQSCAFAHLLGGEERLHDLRLQFRGNTRPVVNDGEHNRTVVQRHIKTDPPLSGLLNNRIESVLQQVQQNLPDLNLTAGNHQGRIDFRQKQIDGVILETLLAYLQGLLHDFGDGGRKHSVVGTLAGQVTHAFYDAGNAVGRLKDTLTVPLGDGQGDGTFFLDAAQKVGC